MRKIAITGGLSAGKTTVCQIFRSLGAYVVSADEVVHRLLSENIKVGQKVIALLGEEILSDGQIDRAKIAKKVFSEPKKLRALEKILHPAVFDEIEKTYSSIEKDGRFVAFVVEVPLLYESESEHLFDTIIAVVADPKLAKQRFQKKRTHDDFEERLSEQWDPMKKASKADFILTNNGSLADLEDAVKKIYSGLSIS